jgi:hypothetical protein
VIADEIERMAEIFARKGSARSGGSNGDGCEVGGRDR